MSLFPISILDFVYHIDALLESIGNPPKIPADPIYCLPWRTQRPGWDTMILDYSKISMIVSESCQNALLIFSILNLSFIITLHRVTLKSIFWLHGLVS